MPEFAHKQSSRRSVVGLRFALSFTLRGEIMAGKPEWLRDLEEKQSARLIADNQAQEINASHKKILDAEIGTLWERVKQGLQEIVSSAELQGLRFTTAPEGENSLLISASSIRAVTPNRVIVIVPHLTKYKFEVMENGRPTGTAVFVAVSDGRSAILDSRNELIRYDEKTSSMADAICQTLLEPFMRDYANSSGLSIWKRIGA
jgi:hypothetical protein